jgi:hypothetical protein
VPTRHHQDRFQDGAHGNRVQEDAHDQITSIPWRAVTRAYWKRRPGLASRRGILPRKQRVHEQTIRTQ